MYHNGEKHREWRTTMYATEDGLNKYDEILTRIGKADTKGSSARQIANMAREEFIATYSRRIEHKEFIKIFG